MRRQRSWKYHAIAFIVGVGILAALIHHAGLERFVDIVLHASPSWFAASLTAYGISWIFRTWRLERFTAHAGTKIKIRDLFKLYISGYALNAIFPAKLGDVATVGYLRIRGITIGRSAAIILQTRILDMVALLFLSLAAVLVSTERISLGWIKGVIFACILIITIPMGLTLLDRNKSLSALIERFVDKHILNTFCKTVGGKIKDAYDSYHAIVSERRLMTVSIVFSIMIWFFEGLTCYMISRAVAAHIPLLSIILAVSTGNMGKIVPATPGAIGIYESMVAAVLVMFGVSFDLATVIAILDHATKKAFTLFFGIPATASL
ncbi:MAG TPA: lysylphosphatidylglycerol synthase transmembrane domain-containing protein [Thermodesulfovibrionales bacterium]|nr:lysylphosphatidylglycerol synthase transmembrane domain-containing protein [Thermodesulfovibrionales bacterium]